MKKMFEGLFYDHLFSLYNASIGSERRPGWSTVTLRRMTDIEEAEKQGGQPREQSKKGGQASRSVLLCFLALLHVMYS